MARDWLRRALAALAAAALVTVCALHAEAQNARKKVPAKAEAEAQQSDEGQDPKAASKTAAKKKKQDPAEAQRAIDAAVKLLEAGKTEQAMQALSNTLAGGNLPPAMMARALLHRGIAYRQQKKPAQAIADLTSALWLKGGLSETDRAGALKQRAAAYQEAGLTESGETIVAAVPPSPPASTPARERTVSTSSGWGAGTTSAPAASLAPESTPTTSSGGGWNVFGGLGNLFGGSSATATPAPSAPSPGPATASIQKSEPPAELRARTSTGWVRNTEVHDSGAASPAAAAAKPEGRLRVQLGMVRTQELALALAAKVKREHAEALANREPEIDQTVVGNMGTFYRVRLGPYGTAVEVQAVCAKLKGSGLDCLTVTQ